MCARSVRVVAAAAALGVASSTPAQPADLLFTNQTAAAQIDAVHSPSVWLYLSQVNVASMLGGGAIGDFNNDGYQDIFVLSGGAVPDKLYINSGDGSFSEQAAAWGVDTEHMGVGTAVGDFDKDGWLDIYVTSLGPATAPPAPGNHLLYRNNNGQSFSNVAARAGVQTTSTLVADGFGAAFGDYDLDGDLDLMVVGWVYSSGCNRLFSNNGDSTFSDATEEAGLSALLTCWGFAPRFVDMDGDLFPELLIAADFQTSRYLLNNTDGTFTDITDQSGTGLDANGMGQTVGDFDADGWLDWYVTSVYTPFSYIPTGVPGTGNMLYMHQGPNLYQEEAVAWGVNDGGWGWGTAAQDFNHDGLLDIAETNGWGQPNGPSYEWVNERCYLFQNVNNASFTDVAESAGLDHDGQGRGLASLDYDNDGDQDLVIFSFDEPLALYRNDVGGPDTHWLRVFLDTTGAPHLAPHGFGSKVEATVAGATQIRSIDGGNNYLVQNELSAYFGVGPAAAIDQVAVHWNDGRVTTLSGVAVNQTIVVRATWADINGNGVVNASDLALLLGAWGPCAACPADLNGNGAVNASDLALLLGSWGSVWSTY